MKICFISNPNSIHTQRWLNWFFNRGHQVTLIGDTELSQPWASIPLYDLPARMSIPKLKYLAWIIWTRQIIKKWKPDILHVHRVTGAGWIGSFTGFHPFAVTPWGSDLYAYPYRSWFAHRLTRHVIQKADLITADSEDLRRQAISFGAKAEKTHLILFGVDLNLFNLAGNSDSLRGELGLGNAPVVLSFRGLHPIYNQETIIRAIPLVRDAVPNVKFIFREYDIDQTYKKNLLSLIAELEIGNTITWIGQLDCWERTKEIYRIANVGVSVSSSDGTPVSVLEALACGLPVIASDLPSLREWIIHGENGFLVPVGDTKALSEAIVQLLCNPGLSIKFREVNHRLIRERGDHQQEMLKMEMLYEKLVMEQKWKKP